MPCRPLARHTLFETTYKNITEKDIVTALITAYQESRYTEDATDGVSYGLFQQTPPWWGTRAECYDPVRATHKFYERLLQVENRDKKTSVQASHEVQRSAYPEAPAQWLDLANAMLRGVSPEGTHYYPVFPYPSYSRAALQDVVDLHAYLATLPADPAVSAPHEVAFPFSVRAGLGLWKALYLDPSWIVDGQLTKEETAGRYLVEGLGHCGECHTPRDTLGGLQRDRWLSGAPTPDGKGRVPNITPGKLDWSEADIVEYLTSGFTPDFDSVGGHMALVIENTSGLPPENRAAIAAYLKKVPALP